MHWLLESANDLFLIYHIGFLHLYGAGSPYSPSSPTNPYGRYGSPFSPDSINNSYGAGNPYSPSSPTNPYGHGLRIEGR